jgi:hypothetical protein
MGFFDSDVEAGSAYDLPTDYKSGLADILGEAKKLYEAKKKTGYQTYEGPQIADFSPEEKAAMAGISGLVGAGKEYFDPAAQYAKGLGEQFTADTAQQYMSPYQQSVVDVEKRKAREDFEQTMQGIGSKAVGAGAFGGSRQAVIEGEAIGDLGQRLGDIQAIGQKQAFDDARKAFEAQKAREKTAGSALAALGQQAPAQALKEYTALAGVGEAGKGMEQAKMDLAYKQFLEQQQFPEQALASYQGTLYGYPYQPYAKQTQGFSRPSSFQNLMGVIGAGKALFPNFGFKEGGHIAFRSQGGLSGLTAHYEDGTGTSTVGSGASEKQSLMDSLKGMMNLSSMSSDLTRLQELRTKIAESKAQKEMGKDTFLNRLGEFAQGVAAGYDPTRPQSMAGSLAAGASAVQERQDPDIIKAQAEAEGLESNIKNKQVLAKLYNDLKVTGLESGEVNTIMKQVGSKYGAMFSEDAGGFVIDGKPVDTATANMITKDILGAMNAANSSSSNKFIAAQQFIVDTLSKKKDNNDPGNQTIIKNSEIQKKINEKLSK